jgi:hypothetical protein
MLGGLLDRLELDMNDQSPLCIRGCEGISILRKLVAAIQVGGAEVVQNLYPVAGDFLRATTIVLMGWAWARLEVAGASGGGVSAFTRWVWPELSMRTQMVLQVIE